MSTTEQPEPAVSDSERPPALSGDASLLREVVRLNRRLVVERWIFASVLVGLVAGLLSPLLFRGVWAVQVGESPLFALKDRAAAQALVASVRRDLAASAGTELRADLEFAQPVEITRADPGRVEVVDAETGRKRLIQAVSLRAQRAVIYIDGISVVALAGVAEAEALLDQLKTEFGAQLASLDEPPSFKEQVEVRFEPAEQALWADSETALALLKGADNHEGYLVRSGDTAWGIGERHGLSLEQLKRLNPAVNWNRLRIGQKLRITPPPDPVVTVVAVGRITERLPTPFPVTREASAELYADKEVVRQPGRPGREEITYQIRTENGKVVSRDLVDRKVVQAATPRVVVVGTRLRPAARPRPPARSSRPRRR